jgi:hypothetical protein
VTYAARVSTSIDVIARRRLERCEYARAMSRALVFYTAVTACLVAGCTSTGTAIDIGDHRVFVPSARISIGTRGEMLSDPQPGGALELGVSYASGKSQQSLSAGQRIDMGDQSFSGPRDTTNEVKAAMFDGALRQRFFGASQRVGFEVLLGLAYSQLVFAVSSAGRRGANTDGSLGVLFGAGVLWRVQPGTSAQARLSLFRAGGFFGETEVNRVELALAQAVGRHAALRAGWSFWAIDASHLVGSEVSARLSGPTLGFDLNF